jgi:hypothetical protein
MRFVIPVAGLLALFGAGSAWAGPEEDLQVLRAEAIAIPGAIVTEFPDFTMVEDNAAFAVYYFTKLGHYAHPAAVQRLIVEEAGAIVVRYATWPYEGPKGAPGGFIRWMEEFAELDRAMREAILGGAR